MRPRSTFLAPFLALLLAPTTFLAAPVSAQLSSGGRPVSDRVTLDGEVPLALLAQPDIRALREQDAVTQDWPLRYGAVIETRLDAAEAGLWQETASGELVWRLRIGSPGALSLGVLFSEYELPVGGQLFLYSADRTTVVGAFTGDTRQPNGMLAIQPIVGDEVVVEYAQPASLRARPRLVVGEVVHDYRGVFGLLDQAGENRLGGGCLIDVNCPEGAPYQDIKRSVIRVLSSGVLCSAGMLNNTAQDGTPYFLTADHCGTMTNVVALFDYERSGCGIGGSSTSRTISGATRLARSDGYDSQLYLLSSAPPASYVPFYAGWDRRAAQPAPTISISHPGGSPKKIALDFDRALGTGLFWNVTWDLGTLQGGSSGSPLFNGEQRVLGPACCVSSFTCSSQIAYYGRLRGFWNVRVNVPPSLDPLGLDPEYIDGFDPFQAIAIAYNGSGINPAVYSSATRPTLGTVWQAEMVAVPGATSTALLAYPAPSSGTYVAAGEVLFQLGAMRLLTSIQPVVGGTSLHSTPLPNDPALIGVSVYTQGFEIGPGVRQLTNAIELRLR
jgi:lysyl endopeptidase